MNQMERTHDDDNRPMDAAPGAPPAGNLNALRQQDSTWAINAAMRQEGGQ
jgi:hypothetical protein